MNSQKRSKPFYTIIQVFIISTLAGYQNITAQDVVSTGGNAHSNANGSISYTIGETVIETFIGDNLILLQGFHQSNLMVTAIDELPGLDFEISVFPNPAAAYVKLRITQETVVGIHYQLYDMDGKLLMQNRPEGIETDIPFRDYSPAEYILRIFDRKNEVKSFKIVKIR